MVNRIAIPQHGTAAAYAVPSLEQARALQAFAKGEATERQQKVAFDFIVRGACGAGRETLAPGQPDVSAYLSGRLSVSLQIGWVLGQPAEVFSKGAKE